MEQLLHYVWQHRAKYNAQLRTTDGRMVTILSPGLHNHNAGPDFLEAHLRIGGDELIGQVELHMRSTDWYRHNHQNDAAYNNVILHVVTLADREVRTQSGRPLPQLELQIPCEVEQRYDELLNEEHYPPCHRHACTLSPQLVRNYLNTLCTERLEYKMERILSLLERFDGDWNRVLFVTLARSFGFGLNGDAFEQWATSIPLMAVGHHRDNLFQIRAIFYGQAGLLHDTFRAKMQSLVSDDELERLQNEYRYLAHKFSLTPMAGVAWKFLRMRPQNFPTVRIGQLCELYYHRLTNLDTFIHATSLEQQRRLFVIPAADGQKPQNLLGKSSLDIVILNAVAPTLFAYGKYLGKASLQDLALQTLRQLPVEKNHITNVWTDLGLDILHAGDSQALIQLRTHYCDRRDCLRCRFGHAYLNQAGNTYPILHR